MDKFLWWLLMRIWTRRARKSYGGPGSKGEEFNTSNFQKAVGKTTGQTVGEQTSRMWLVEYGYSSGGGCHWSRRSKKKLLEYGRFMNENGPHSTQQ